MWFGIFLILVAIPLLELALLIKLGQTIGFWATIAVIFLTAGVGIMIMNAQGFAAMRRASEGLRQGKPPIEPVMDGFMLMLAGALLVAPGLITDVAGLLLLIPPLRRAIAAWGLRRFMASGNIHVSTWSSEEVRSTGNVGRGRPRSGDSGATGTVIEGEFERIDEKTAAPKRAEGLNKKPLRPE